MKIFKFGGASVKDHHGVINLFKIIKLLNVENTLIVVSAMGKTTNAFEKVVNAYFNDFDQISFFIDEIKKMHFKLIENLFKDIDEELKSKLDKIFYELNDFISSNKNMNYSYVYDQIVSNGELLSTIIIHNYLKNNGLKNSWLDSRICIKTDSYFRDSNLDWIETDKMINKHVNKNSITITQGFIGSDSEKNTTTLGREGSDYSAAIFAYSLNADSVTIWKDVPGVLNGDPRIFRDLILLNKISYREAIELAFYGASVIHPKTLQPLQYDQREYIQKLALRLNYQTQLLVDAKVTNHRNFSLNKQYCFQKQFLKIPPSICQNILRMMMHQEKPISIMHLKQNLV